MSGLHEGAIELSMLPVSLCERCCSELWWHGDIPCCSDIRMILRVPYHSPSIGSLPYIGALRVVVWPSWSLEHLLSMVCQRTQKEDECV